MTPLAFILVFMPEKGNPIPRQGPDYKLDFLVIYYT